MSCFSEHASVGQKVDDLDFIYPDAREFILFNRKNVQRRLHPFALAFLKSLTAVISQQEHQQPYPAYNPQTLSPKHPTSSNSTRLSQEFHTRQNEQQKCLETRLFPRNTHLSSLHPSI